ncbi:hypothetical protein L596_003799 [Steinernema carpocapsae]|uniref:Uncharacterized protein n=1 Tax=Steinernema carpocapsae TaxID=34508 RepID=A0A4U8UVD7_STECR|nr:hypothetical protein L596_003799 [Steinernema carpocapsae]
MSYFLLEHGKYIHLNLGKSTDYCTHLREYRPSPLPSEATNCPHDPRRRGSRYVKIGACAWRTSRVGYGRPSTCGKSAFEEPEFFDRNGLSFQTCRGDGSGTYEKTTVQEITVAYDAPAAPKGVSSTFFRGGPVTVEYKSKPHETTFPIESSKPKGYSYETKRELFEEYSSTHPERTKGMREYLDEYDKRMAGESRRRYDESGYAGGDSESEHSPLGSPPVSGVQDSRVTTRLFSESDSLLGDTTTTSIRRTAESSHYEKKIPKLPTSPPPEYSVVKSTMPPAPKVPLQSCQGRNVSEIRKQFEISDVISRGYHQRREDHSGGSDRRPIPVELLRSSEKQVIKEERQRSAKEADESYYSPPRDYQCGPMRSEVTQTRIYDSSENRGVRSIAARSEESLLRKTVVPLPPSKPLSPPPAYHDIRPRTTVFKEVTTREMLETVRTPVRVAIPRERSPVRIEETKTGRSATEYRRVVESSKTIPLSSVYPEPKKSPTQYKIEKVRQTVNHEPPPVSNQAVVDFSVVRSEQERRQREAELHESFRSRFEESRTMTETLLREQERSRCLAEQGLVASYGRLSDLKKGQQRYEEIFESEEISTRTPVVPQPSPQTVKVIEEVRETREAREVIRPNPQKDDVQEVATSGETKSEEVVEEIEKPESERSSRTQVDSRYEVTETIESSVHKRKLPKRDFSEDEKEKEPEHEREEEETIVDDLPQPLPARLVYEDVLKTMEEEEKRKLQEEQRRRLIEKTITEYEINTTVEKDVKLTRKSSLLEPLEEQGKVDMEERGVGTDDASTLESFGVAATVVTTDSTSTAVDVSEDKNVQTEKEKREPSENECFMFENITETRAKRWQIKVCDCNDKCARVSTIARIKNDGVKSDGSVCPFGCVNTITSS